jgi:hypothetical protein
VLPSLNVTLPVGPEDGVTVAVNETEVPYMDGFNEEVTAVVVDVSDWPQDENLKEPMRVLQLAVCVVAWYSWVYQKVQSSIGSIRMAE